MTTRVLLADDGRIRLYRVLDSQGVQIGVDEEAIPTTVDINSATMRSRAINALTANGNYLAVGTPTNAQVVAQVAALTKECSGIIRLMLGQLDDITGT